MRLDQGLVALGGLSALYAVYGRGIEQPRWEGWLALLVAVATLVLTRARGERAAPRELRPAVLIPVKDNAGTIGAVVGSALQHGLPVYVIDDGSTDGSGERCAGATVLRHARNWGKGRALLTGMQAAKAAGCSHAICLDADGQHDPADIPSFVEAIRRAPNAIVAGSRDMSLAPGRSQFGRKFSNFWAWAETGWRIADTQCGFRAYPIDAVLDLGLAGSRYELEIEVFTRAIWAGTPVVDLPCKVYYPPAEERVSSFDPFRDNVRISLMNSRLFFRRVLWPPLWLPRIRQSEAGWSGKSRGTAFGWAFLLALLKFVGRRPVHAVVGGLAGWYTLFASTPGIAAYRAKLGAGAPSVFAIYRSFAITLVDRVAFLLQGPGAFRYEDEGVRHVVKVFAHGGILLSGHLGNIEIAAGGASAEDRRQRLSILRFEAERDHSRGIAPSLPRTWQPDVIAVNRKEGFSTLAVLRGLRAGAVVAMHGDRLVDERVVHVDFLGGRMAVPAGPWMLAALAGVPVVVCGCFRDGDAYRIVAEEPVFPRFNRSRSREEQVQEWAQAYAATLDRWARRWPDQWYNFHDVWRESGL